MRTRVKICGFTQVDAAIEAARLGADAIGLVFYPASPRNVSIEQARQIAYALPAFVSVVALFVDADADLIEKVLAQVPVDCIQFHGDEHPDECRRYAKPYIKAIRVRDDTDLDAVQRQYHDAAGILLDTYHPGMPGGSGCTFNWQLIPRHTRLPIILAGGLTDENVGRAIEQVRPYAVDVSSGVEAGKGIKSAEKMAAFIKRTIRATENYD